MTQIRGDIEVAKNIDQDLNAVYPESQMLQKRLEWFQDLKLGVIFHWGLYAEAGIVESWQLSEKDEWAREPESWRETVQDLQLDYWNLVSTFNPKKFNANEWASTCKQAGFKYCLFTTKHHDGFNMYNTQETEYKIGGKLSPFKRDPLAEISDAFRKEGISMGTYYSKADWFSQYYWLDDQTPKGRGVSYNPDEHPEIWEKYVSFVHRQIKEIMHNYGKIDFLWLDAGWCGQGKEDLHMDRLAEIAREKQPELIIVDRMMGGRHENYVTPERKIPEIHEIPSKVWESNIPLGNDWGFVPTDTFKSSQEIIETFVDVVSKGGNLILGVGPTPQGTFTDEEKQILFDLGEWLDIYGEGIYETRALPKLKDGDWKITQKQEQLYYVFISTQKSQQYPLFQLSYLGLGIDEVEEVIDLQTRKSVPYSLGKVDMKQVAQPKVGCCGFVIKRKGV